MGFTMQKFRIGIEHAPTIPNAKPLSSESFTFFHSKRVLIMNFKTKQNKNFMPTY